MAAKIKTIGVLTSGGDAPGMNAAIRAVVRKAICNGVKVKGIKKGYQGLLNEEIIDMDARSVSDTIQKGGTILGTARCLEFKTEAGQKKGAEICRRHGIDGLVVIGGDGSYRGAQAMSRLGINTIGLPGTIDLDIACTEYTIGFDTAVNTAMQAIDKVRDTSSSHERCSIIEVMGRNAGYIALWCGVSTGAEDILLPEKYDYDEQQLINNIINNRKKGKTHHLIINAEGIGHSTSMAKRIEAATGVETRATILGYMQRGGSSTCLDRYYASIMGAYAADILCAGSSNRVVAYKHGGMNYDIEKRHDAERDSRISLSGQQSAGHLTIQDAKGRLHTKRVWPLCVFIKINGGTCMITAASNSRIKRLVQLNQKSKLRRTEDVFLAEGVKMFLEAPREQLQEVYVSESFLEKCSCREHLEEVGYEVVSDSVFSKISDTCTPQGVLCVLKQFHYNIEEMLRDKAPLFLLLENIQDPGNLGTMLRTGEGAGVSGIIMSRDTVGCTTRRLSVRRWAASTAFRFIMRTILRRRFIRYSRRVSAYTRRICAPGKIPMPVRITQRGRHF